MSSSNYRAVTINLVIAISFISSPLFSQFHITYRYDYYDSNGAPVQATPFEDKIYQDYYVLGGNYKSIYDGGGNWMDIYNSDENIRYEIDKEGNISSFDAKKRTEYLLEIIELDTVALVQGYQCNAIKLIYENYTSVYFYSSDVSIQASKLSNHNYGNWNEIISKMKGGIPLKYITTYENGYYSAEPILIERVNLTKNDFEPKQSIKQLRDLNSQQFSNLIDQVKLKYKLDRNIDDLVIEGMTLQGNVKLPLELKVMNPSSIWISMKFGDNKFYYVSSEMQRWEYNPMEDKVVLERFDEENKEKDVIDEFAPLLNNNWKTNEVYSFKNLSGEYRVLIKKDNSFSCYYFKKETYFVNTKMDGSNIYTYDDYKIIEGLPFAMSYSQMEYNGEKPTFAFSVNKVNFNEGLKKDSFDVPSHLKSKVVQRESGKTKESYFEEGEQFLDKQNYREAVASYKKAIEIDNSNPLYYNQYGVALLRSGDNYGAITAFTKAIEQNSNYAKGWFNLGYTKMKMGDYKGAIGDISRAIDIDPENPLYHNNKGLCYFNLNKYDSALQDFRRVVTLDSTYNTGFWNVAMSYYNIENYDSAIVAFNNSEEIGFTSPSLYNFRGICYFNQEDYQSALVDFKEATKFENIDAIYFQNLGTAYSELGDTKQAIKSFNKALEMDSTLVESYNLIGLEYLNDESFEAAIKYFSKAINLDNSNPVYFDNRGKAKDSKMDFIGAIDDYTSSIALYPDDGYIFYLRGLAKKNIDDKFDACRDFKKASELGEELADELLKKYCNTN